MKNRSRLTFPPIMTVLGVNCILGLLLRRLYIVMMWRMLSSCRLVLVDSLDLHVKHRGRLHLHVELLLDQRRQLHLILLLLADEILNFNS